MKKLFLFLLVAMMLLGCATTAYAATIPAGAITLTAETVDYVSALSGIAKPISTTHYENERVAILVKVVVPSWFDTTNMSIVLDATGLSIDSAVPSTVATGNYLIFGTLYSSNARLTVTAQDNAIASATNVQALWAALYGDRSVSATVNFGAVVAAASGSVTVPTVPVVEIPQTGDKPTSLALCACALGVIGMVTIILLRKRKRGVE